MNLPQHTEIGKIQRAHGVNGEIQINWISDFDPDQHRLESVFIPLDGIPVPFFVKSIRSKSNTASLLILDGIETLIQAQQLVTCKVYAEVKRDSTEDELTLDDLIGYTIITSKGVQFGSINHLEDFSGNLVFQVIDSLGNEVLIPANPDFILEINEESKSLVMEIPEGLAEL